MSVVLKEAIRLISQENKLTDKEKYILALHINETQAKRVKLLDPGEFRLMVLRRLAKSMLNNSGSDSPRQAAQNGSDSPKGTNQTSHFLLSKMGWRITGRLSGFSSDIYLAVDHLNEPLVIKRLHPEEERVLRIVLHEYCPNMVEGTIVKGNRSAYFGMRMYRGTVLSLVGVQPQMSQEIIAQKGKDIKRALEHVHKLNLVHMDVKPENILLDQEGRWYLADFGSCVEKGAKIGCTTESQYPYYLDGKCAHPKFDFYMLGVTLLQIVVFKDSSDIKNFCATEGWVDVSIKKLESEKLKTLVKELIYKDVHC